MIIINGSKFAENESEFIDSLFQAPVTCKGYAKRLKRTIKIYNMQKELIGVVNAHNVLCCASKVENGFRYSLATIPEIGEFSGYMDRRDNLESLAVDRDSKGYIYK